MGGRGGATSKAEARRTTASASTVCSVKREKYPDLSVPLGAPLEGLGASLLTTAAARQGSSEKGPESGGGR